MQLLWGGDIIRHFRHSCQLVGEATCMHEDQYPDEWLSAMEWCLRNFHWSSAGLRPKIIGLEVAGPSHQSAVPAYTSDYKWVVLYGTISLNLNNYLASVGSVCCVIGSHTDQYLANITSPSSWQRNLAATMVFILSNSNNWKKGSLQKIKLELYKARTQPGDEAILF